MKSPAAVLLLVAAVFEVAFVAAVVTGQYQLALETIVCGSLVLWAVFAFVGRDLFATRRETDQDRYREHVAGRYARYGVHAAPVVRRSGALPPLFLQMLFATVAAATVIGAAFGFAMAGDIATAGAISGAAALGGLAVYCAQTQKSDAQGAGRHVQRPLPRRR
ncbi:hypothetical protein [Rhizobium sp. CSW-27]|uniref:hypothetical protein n=1 Tax=Rhizobium sp. CSW-27 TaxID=2839985 RepID=UPI001C02AF0F|nr:hypothetical protein [Rhizobium sp. CSW-27]MBT9372281.1 hypothetical protein [Rhizobium sp. CSW-27]